MSPDLGGFRGRAGLLASLMAFLFALVILRLVDLQVLRRPSLQARAERQQFARVEVPGKRGTIRDRNGEILVESVATESVFVSAPLVKAEDRGRVAKALASSLGVSEREMRQRLHRNRPFWAKRNARLEATARLKEYKFPAISYQAETRRVYPQGRLASHVLGFTDVDGRGLEGVERSYQKVLAGRAGVKEVLRDAAGRQIPNQQVWVSRPRDGGDLILTLDAQLQHIAERELAKAVAKFKAKGAALALMDPYSGELLALASVPDYDPAHPGAYSADARRNRAVSDVFEPGSTFKAVTAALAFERGVVDPDTPVDCRGGKAEFFRRVVRDHGDARLGVVPFRRVLAESSNVGTVEVALKLGPTALYEGMRRFGFGEPTGIDLPGEAVGILRDLKDWSPGSMAAVPFGQEFSCNLLRMLVTYAALANGGTLVRPHVVKEMVAASGAALGGVAAGARGKVVSEGVLDKLVPILEDVVDEGTGVAIALPGYAIAGKTGTAQKYDLARGRYSQTDNTATFVGFVPARKPVFVAAVMIDEPRGITLGGWTAGPVFRAVVSAALTAYGVAPSESLRAQQAASAERALRAPDAATRWSAVYRRGAKAAELESVDVPNVLHMTRAAAQAALAKAGLRARVLGEGRVVAQFPEAGAEVLRHSTVTLSLEPEAPTPRRGAARQAAASVKDGLLSRFF